MSRIQRLERQLSQRCENWGKADRASLSQRDFKILVMLRAILGLRHLTILTPSDAREQVNLAKVPEASFTNLRCLHPLQNGAKNIS